jgi:hypothetical protein
LKIICMGVARTNPPKRWWALDRRMTLLNG